MPDHPCCHECTWYVARGVSRGHCRRHAPRGQGFPEVRWDDWCGDHARQEAPLPAPLWDDLPDTARLHDPTGCRVCQAQETHVPCAPEEA